MIVERECPQCGNMNPPEDNFCRECIFKFEEYNLDDLKVKKHHEDLTVKKHQWTSLNIMIFIIIFIGSMILLTFTYMIQYYVQQIIPALILWPIKLRYMM